MNQTSPNADDLRTTPLEGKLDRALSDFFKSKMKQPWPAAPETHRRMPASEPSLLVASRAANLEAPRNQPVAQSQSRDWSNKSRYTLAVSVALLLGTCWLLSSGSRPGERVGPGGNNPPKIDFFGTSGASDPAALQEHKKDNAEKANKGAELPKFQLP
jgi:hypothetical protein